MDQIFLKCDHSLSTVCLKLLHMAFGIKLILKYDKATVKFC